MHAWVATFHYDDDRACGVVKFWETTTGLVYTLKHRFRDPYTLQRLSADPEFGILKMMNIQRRKRLSILGVSVDADTPDYISRSGEDLVQSEFPTGGAKLPYRSLDIMFNNRNVWLNIQDGNPAKVWFDIWDVVSRSGETVPLQAFLASSQTRLGRKETIASLLQLRLSPFDTLRQSCCDVRHSRREDRNAAKHCSFPRVFARLQSPRTRALAVKSRPLNMRKHAKWPSVRESEFTFGSSGAHSLSSMHIFLHAEKATHHIYK
ncbi:hypothetical protein TGMAS_240910C [Toxoplasma gondii MAS]|uniref:Uncharacterized protein n=1 Tax=Toxoplasma gondii MAS TaxID=943118 RepID=A0A086QQK8_TOXGO|nr:hypothetical protein TGMAS_240910C [Toxoplasma gondii MAS]